MVGQGLHIEKYSSDLQSLGDEAMQDLENLVEANPWCAAYRILLARSHKNTQSQLQNQKLNIASLYALDRRHLFHVMHDKSLPRKGKQELEQVQASNEIETEVIEDIQETAMEDIPTPKNELTEDKPVEIVLGKPSNSLKAFEFTLETENKKLDTNQEQDKSSSTENKVDFDNAVKYDPTIELKPNPVEKKEEKIEIPFDQVVYNPEVELRKLEQKKDSEKEQAKDFYYWLDHVGDKDPVSNEVESPPESNSVDEVQDLLNAFLETKRNKPRIKQEFYKAEEKANRSETDDLSIVSESLANLYERQELYQKAIATFKKLSLQIPSKSAYFAGRISELEKLIDNKTK